MGTRKSVYIKDYGGTSRRVFTFYKGPRGNSIGNKILEVEDVREILTVLNLSFDIQRFY